ncbi:hypothetical protein ACP4OV_024876 [Aristida adscensionis]
MAAELDIAPAAAATQAVVAAAARRRAGWTWRMYSPVGAEQWASPRAAAAPPAGAEERPSKQPGARRGGWLRRVAAVAGKDRRALGRRWTKLSAASSKLAAGLRWKRAPAISFGGGGGCAAAVVDAVSFRVMYVVEAVVLGLALSCFFCCCGCQI